MRPDINRWARVGAQIRLQEIVTAVNALHAEAREIQTLLDAIDTSGTARQPRRPGMITNPNAVVSPHAARIAKQRTPAAREAARRKTKRYWAKKRAETVARSIRARQASRLRRKMDIPLSLEDAQPLR